MTPAIRMTRQIITLTILATCIGTGCQSPGTIPPSRNSDLTELAGWLSGSFSSQAQSKEDTDFLDIRLNMIPIWTERKDGHWLYVEQATVTALDRPYRQRVYNVVARADGRFESIVFELPGDPQQFAGAWKKPEQLAALEPQQLQLRARCSIFLRRNRNGSFEGGTRGNGCSSTRRGASYATSEVKLTYETLTTWDRGFDAEGKQVWGAQKGGYVFRRIRDGD
jgi:hypothetical protein